MTKGWTRSLLATAFAACVVAPIAQAQAQPIELKVSHYLPPNHSIHKALETWSQDLAARSNGRLKLTVFPAGQMGPVTRQYDLARTGVADVAFVLHGALPGRFPLTEIAHLPYVFNRVDKGASTSISTAQASAILTELAPQLTAEYEGTKPLYFIATPTMSLFFNKGEIRSPAAMRGLRMRHNGPIPAAMLEAWGAAPAAVAPAELADALAKGTVAGMIFNFEAAKSFQMAESVKSVTLLNASAATFALVMNAEKYKSLPEELRKLIDETTGPEAARKVGAIYDQAEEEGRNYLMAAKVKIVDLTPAERAAFEDAVKPVAAALLTKAESKSPKSKQIYEQVRTSVGGIK